MIVLLGRPGSGKGTQGRRLAERLGWVHVSTGDILRAAVADGGPLGNGIRRVIQTGELVDDELVVAATASHIADLPGVVLDGFPRTVRQAELLSDTSTSPAIDLAVHLVVPCRVAVTRLLDRRVWDGEELVRRADDTERGIATRLARFEEQTRPVLAWFAARGLLAQVDGTGHVDDVQVRVDACLAPLRQQADRASVTSAG